MAVGVSLVIHAALLGVLSMTTSPQPTAFNTRPIQVSLASPAKQMAEAPQAPSPAEPVLPPQPPAPVVATAPPVAVTPGLPLPQKSQPQLAIQAMDPPRAPSPARHRQAAPDSLSDDVPAWMQRAAATNQQQRHRPADWIAFKVTVDGSGRVLHYEQVSTEDSNVDSKALLIEEIKRLSVPESAPRTMIVSGPPLVIETDPAVLSEYLGIFH